MYSSTVSTIVASATSSVARWRSSTQLQRAVVVLDDAVEAALHACRRSRCSAARDAR